MKKLLIASLIASYSVASFASADGCKSKALNVAKAIDKVYVAKMAKNTKITISDEGKTVNSRIWLVNFYVPNAGGATSYTIEMQKESCEIMNLSMISE